MTRPDKDARPAGSGTVIALRPTMLLFSGATVLAGTILVVAGTTHASVARAADKVPICHRYAAVTSPYGPKRITVSVNTINNGPAHSGHTGPVFDPATMHQGDTWGDIIPPVPEINFPGLNWDAAGQAIWNNNCQVVVAAPSSSTVVTTTSSSSGSSSSSSSSDTSSAASSSDDSSIADTSAASSSAADQSDAASSSEAATGGGGPIPDGADAGLHAPTARSSLTVTGTFLIIAGGLLALLAARRPRRRRVH